jgi:hypothetical protein
LRYVVDRGVDTHAHAHAHPHTLAHTHAHMYAHRDTCAHITYAHAPTNTCTTVAVHQDHVSNTFS